MDVFAHFLGASRARLAPKPAESGSGTVTSVFPMLFYVRGLAESLGGLSFADRQAKRALRKFVHFDIL